MKFFLDFDRKLLYILMKIYYISLNTYENFQFSLRIHEKIIKFVFIHHFPESSLINS